MDRGMWMEKERRNVIRFAVNHESPPQIQAKNLAVCLSNKSLAVYCTESGAHKAALRLGHMGPCSKRVIYLFCGIDPCVWVGACFQSLKREKMIQRL